MFKVRFLSSIVLMAFMLFFIIYGENYLLFAIAFLSLVGMMEFMRMAKLHKTPIAVLGYASVFSLYLMHYLNKTELIVPLIVVYLLAIMLFYVLSFPKYKADQMMYLFFGFFYTALMLSYIYQIRMLDGGEFLVWLVFVSAWGSDVFAYCVGMLIGKHKAFPVLSPKKSWEGCIGGVAGAALVAVIYGAVLNGAFHQEVSVALFAILGACGSVIAQIGDLAASAMKRNNEVKDYGKLIPGHGGVLDRFDSVIFVAPIIYYLIQFGANF